MDAAVASGAHADATSIRAMVIATQSLTMGALVVLVAFADAIDTFTMIIAVDSLTCSTSPRQITLANTVHARAVVIAIVTRLTGYTFTVLACIALLAHTIAFSVISTMVGATQNAAVLYSCGLEGSP